VVVLRASVFVVVFCVLCGGWSGWRGGGGGGGGGPPPREPNSQTLLPGKVRLIGFPGI